MINAASLYLLPGTIGAFREAHPDVDLRLLVDTSEALMDRLRRFELDLAFVIAPAGADLEAVPVRTELLHLYLLVSLLFMLPYRKSGKTGLALTCTLLFFLLLNRVSCTPFAGWILLLVAWSDRTRADRSRVLRERLCMLSAVIAGVVFDYSVCAVTMLRLQHISNTIITALLILSAAAIALDLWHTSSRVARNKILSVPSWILSAGIALLILYLAAAYFNWNVLSYLSFVPNPHKGLVQTLPYMGPGLVVCALIGLLFMAAPGNRMTAYATFSICLFGFPALTLLVNDHIASIYPWATRRLVPYMLPLLVLLAGYALDRVYKLTWREKKVGRGVATAALIGIAISMFGEAEKAWKSVEFSGLTEAVRTLAKEIPEDALVVADHSWWATPLTHLYGGKVLNGEHLWKSSSQESFTERLNVLKRKYQEGQRVVWFTSTDRALEIYSYPVGSAALIHTASSLTIDENVHSSRNTSYAQRQQTFQFRLYEWEPE